MFFCAGLFSIFLLMQSEICVEKMRSKLGYLRALSWQLEQQEYQGTFTVFISFDYFIGNTSFHRVLDSCVSELTSRDGAGWNKSIILRKFDQMSLLRELGVSKVATDQLFSWPSTVVNAARKSDLYRSLIAMQHSSTYVDLDTVLLGPVQAYAVPFVATTVFRREGAIRTAERDKPLVSLSPQSAEFLNRNSARFDVEFSNSAFCLPPLILKALIQHQVNKILQLASGSSKLEAWSFVELGAGALRDVLLSPTPSPLVFSPLLKSGRKPEEETPPPPSLLSTNWPHDFHLSSLKAQVKTSGHSLVHLMGFAHADQTAIERDFASLDNLPVFNQSLTLYERYVRVLFQELASPNSAFPVDNNQSSLPPPLQLPPSTPACQAGLFSTVDAVLAGPWGNRRPDCCIEAHSPFFKQMLAEAARQASNLGLTLTLFVSGDGKVSRCGRCVQALIKSWARDGYGSDPIGPEPTLPSDPQLDAKSTAIVSSALKKGVLRVEDFQTESLLRDCGVNPADTAVMVWEAERVLTELESELRKGVVGSVTGVGAPGAPLNASAEPTVSNVRALEALEALTTLCLARQSARAFVSLNVLLLEPRVNGFEGNRRRDPTAGRSAGGENATARWKLTPSLAQPFLAVASRRTHFWEANAFSTAHAFCVPPLVAQVAAVRLINKQLELQQAKQLTGQQKRANEPREKRSNPKGPLSSNGKTQSQSQGTPDPYWSTAVDSQTHEEMLAETLWSTWLVLSNVAVRSSSGQGMMAGWPEALPGLVEGVGAALTMARTRPPRLLSLPPPHLGGLSAVLGALRGGESKPNHSMVLISGSLVENTMREALREVVSARRSKQKPGKKVGPGVTTSAAPLPVRTVAATSAAEAASLALTVQKIIYAVRQAS